MFPFLSTIKNVNPLCNNEKKINATIKLQQWFKSISHVTCCNTEGGVVSHWEKPDSILDHNCAFQSINQSIN